jgi:hypothetical protein
MQHATNPSRAAVLALLGALAVVGSTTTLCVADVAHAGTCTVDALPSSGTVTPAHFNRRFDQVESCINGNIGDANIASTETISLSKLTTQYALTAVHKTISCNNSTDFIFMAPVDGKAFAVSADCYGCDGTSSITVALKVDSTTAVSITGIDDTTTQYASGGTTAFTGGTSVLSVQTSGTVGACTSVQVTGWLKTPLQQ